MSTYQPAKPGSTQQGSGILWVILLLVGGLFVAAACVVGVAAAGVMFLWSSDEMITDVAIETPTTTASVAIGQPVSLAEQTNYTDLLGLPTSPQQFNGVFFSPQPGVIQLSSSIEEYRGFEDSVENITVNRRCDKLHFLHASQGGGYQTPGHDKHEADGVLVGRYVVHYEDGSQEEIPLRYGEELRGWWTWDGGKPTTNCQLAWTGDNPHASQYDQRVRLYHMIWENPHPEKPVASLDFSSAGAKAAPFCVAISTE